MHGQGGLPESADWLGAVSSLEGILRLSIAAILTRVLKRGSNTSQVAVHIDLDKIKADVAKKHQPRTQPKAVVACQLEGRDKLRDAGENALEQNHSAPSITNESLRISKCVLLKTRTA